MKKVLLLLSLIALIFQTSNGQDVARELRQMLNAYVESGEIPGAIGMVADKDGVLWTECVGFADIAMKEPMSENTLFWIASQSKPITAVALMMLVEEGKVDLDLPIGEYLPELQDIYVLTIERGGVRVLEKPAVQPTLRMLLSHTSGMAWVGSVQQSTGKIDVLPLSLGVHISASTPLIAQPGTVYHYSNQGINIVASVIEKIAGMPFDRFLEDRIFIPLGMSSATFWPSAEEQKTLALPYRMDSGSLVPTSIDQLQYPLDDKTKRYAEAAGGLFCTPADLVKFYRMVAGNGVFEGKRFLSEESVKILGSKQTPDQVAHEHGLGWGANDWFLGHGGAYGTDTKIYKKNGKIVMYFIQSEGLPGNDKAFSAFESAVRTAYDMHP